MLPTSSDLVTDLPADFDIALQGVDTRLKALQPGTTLGDLAYSSATANTNTRLPIGTSGQVLAVSGGGVPAWTTTADVTPLTTKGDLFSFTTVDARLAVGADGTTLVADSSTATGLKWAAPAGGGGKVLQVVQGTFATDTSTTSTTLVDTGLNQSITPAASSSKVLITVTIPYFVYVSASNTAGARFVIKRGATEIGNYSAAPTVFLQSPTSGSNEVDGTWAITFLDSPATTSSTNYKVQFLARSPSTVGLSPGTVTSTITLMEIGA